MNEIILKTHSDTLIVWEWEQCHLNWNCINDRLEGSCCLRFLCIGIDRLTQRPICMRYIGNQDIQPEGCDSPWEACYDCWTFLDNTYSCSLVCQRGFFTICALLKKMTDIYRHWMVDTSNLSKLTHSKSSAFKGSVCMLVFTSSFVLRTSSSSVRCDLGHVNSRCQFNELKIILFSFNHKLTPAIDESLDLVNS